MTRPNATGSPGSHPANDLPLSGLRFALLGAGRVGSSLAHWLVACGAEACSVIGREPGVAGRSLAKTLDAEWHALDRGTTGGLDLLLLTLSDGALADVARQLAERAQADVALHVSGSLDASVLAPLRSVGTAVGSCHPLRAFSVPAPDLEVAHGTWFGIDGDPPAVDLAHRLVDAWRGRPVVLEPAQRTAYHLAASLAAGGVTTVLSVVEEIMTVADLPPSLITGYLALTEGALVPLGQGEGASKAITGPAARGDGATLERHRRMLQEKAPDLLSFFDHLSAETRRQVARGPGKPGPDDPEETPP